MQRLREGGGTSLWIEDRLGQRERLEEPNGDNEDLRAKVNGASRGDRPAKKTTKEDLARTRSEMLLLDIEEMERRRDTESTGIYSQSPAQILKERLKEEVVPWPYDRFTPDTHTKQFNGQLFLTTCIVQISRPHTFHLTGFDHPQRVL